MFAWTDEWHRGENEVLDWDFGLTDRQGNGKPALSSVADAFGEGVPAEPGDLPTVSVVVCSHNGASTLTECLEGVLALDYPSFEVLLVDDGSTDRSACIGRELGVRADFHAQPRTQRGAQHRAGRDHGRDRRVSG